MSTPHTLFTVTLTTAEIQGIRDLLGKSGDARILEALDAAKPVRATRPRATPAAVEPFSPSTGNPAVDAFMRRKHRPDWEAHLRKALRRNVPGAIPMPAPAPGWPLKPKDARSFSALFG